jgi:hypothetical protein
MVIKKGCIEDTPKDMELENFIQQFNPDNHNKHPMPFKITATVRPTTRLKETNEETEGERWVWKESGAVYLTFRTKELPPHVYICNMKIEISTFAASVRRCYKCGKFGHISKFCTNEKQCFSCGEAKREGYCIKICLNCNGNHTANTERCPVIKKQKEINQLMAQSNVGFLEARKFFE